MKYAAPTRVSLYTSTEAEEHLQRAYKEAHGVYCSENIRELSEILNSRATKIGPTTFRTATSWPATAVTWLLEDVFGWGDRSYLFIHQQYDGETRFGCPEIPLGRQPR